MANYTRKQNKGLEAVVGSEQSVSQNTEQYYDQVIATQRQVAGKDYQSIVSGLSKYDFQGTLSGVKTYVKKELSHLSAADLVELSTSLKDQYQTQKAADALDKSDRREYRSTIATVNYYLNRKKKEDKVQKIASMERQGNWSYKRKEDAVLASDFIQDEVYAADIVKKKSSLEDAFDVIKRLNGVKVEPQKEEVKLDVFDLAVKRKESPEYSGLSYHLRQPRAFKRGDDEYLTADFIDPVMTSNPVDSDVVELDTFDLLEESFSPLHSGSDLELIAYPESENEDLMEREANEDCNEVGQATDAGLRTVRQAVYEEETEKALLPRWDNDHFFDRW